MTVLGFTPELGVTDWDTTAIEILELTVTPAAGCGAPLPFLFGSVLADDDGGALAFSAHADYAYVVAEDCGAPPIFDPRPWNDCRGIGFASDGSAPPVYREWNPLEERWREGFGDPATGGNGLDACVRALAEWPSGSGYIYAGGYFEESGPITSNAIAVYDPSTSTWSALDSGLGNSIPTQGPSVHALLPRSGGSGDVVVGGQFDTAGSIDANCIASWSGSTWSAIGNGFQTERVVRALALYNSGELYAGGDFVRTADSVAVTVNKIAKLESGQWVPLVDSITSEVGISDANAVVHALATYQSKLIVGGSFPASGNRTGNIATWDDFDSTNLEVWGGLGSGLDGAVRALLVYNGELYAGGEFTHAGAVETNRIARWNGTTWNPVGDGLDNTVHSFLVYDTQNQNHLMVAGVFGQAFQSPTESILCRRVARWQVDTWVPLGDGLDDPISECPAGAGAAFAFAQSGASLFVGGGLKSAGTSACARIPSFGIAMWEDSYAVDVPDYESQSISGEELSLSVFPNPARSATIISYDLRTTQEVSARVYDVAGRVVSTLVSERQGPGVHTTQWDGSSSDGVAVAAGVYFVRVRAGEFNTAVRKIVITR